MGRGRHGAEPRLFNPNGYTVTALQAAWAAITSTDEGDGSPLHLQRGLHAAVHAGDDTDTIAAVLAQARRAVSPRHLGSGFLDRGLEICAPISALPT